MFLRSLRLPFVGTTGAMCYTAYAHKPEQESAEYHRTGLYSPETTSEHVLLKFTRNAAIGAVTVISKVFIEYLNDFKIVGNEANHRYLMQQIELGTENRARALLTVSNHTSVFDDPVLQCSIVGFLPSDKHRWGVCKEKICFKNDFIASFTSAGKVLPIEVGAGVDQTKFKAVGRRLVDGEWVHLFPEAACNQTGEFGCERSREERERIGRLKWGVGKLVGKLEHAPVIIPYYHLGMEKVKPQDGSKEKRLVDPWYSFGRTGNKIRVVVGEPIYTQDLLDEYKHARRAAQVDKTTGEFKNWDGPATALEQELYSKITKRIEIAMLELEQEAIRCVTAEDA